MLRCTSLLLFASLNVNAGAYLDLAIGRHASPWMVDNRVGGDYIGIGGQNPLGVFRFGYDYGNKIKGFMEYSHISSIPDSNDSGLNVIMIGIRFSD